MTRALQQLCRYLTFLYLLQSSDAVKEAQFYIRKEVDPPWVVEKFICDEIGEWQQDSSSLWALSEIFVIRFKLDSLPIYF